jgi:5-methylcytosine-specific restriction enzyme A
MARLKTLGNRVQMSPSKLSSAIHIEASRSSTQRGYGYKWQQARARYLSKHPLCAHCEAAGKVTIATDLDHIVPHKGDMALFWDSDGWQGLCKSCHSIKTATEDGGFGNIGPGGYAKR